MNLKSLILVAIATNQLVDALPLDKRVIVTVTRITHTTTVIDNPVNAAATSTATANALGYNKDAQAQSATTQAATTQAASLSSGSSGRGWRDILSSLFGLNDSSSQAQTTSQAQATGNSQFATASDYQISQTSTQASTPTSTQAIFSSATDTGAQDIYQPSSSSQGTYTASSASFDQSDSTSTSFSSSKLLSDVSSGFSDTTNEIWQRFWLSSENAFNSNDDICGGASYDEPSLWNQAVIGRASVLLQDNSKIGSIINNINDYQNSQLKVFSASTAKDTDIYTDDNAQIAWVFIDAYQQTQNQQYLEAAKYILNFLQNQTINGGVIWQYQADYIASISTVEAALAAVRLHEITNDDSLIQYAQKNMDFMFQYLQDPSDKLFYDGLSQSDYSDVNKGKLSYTVGCALSTLAYLYKDTGNTYYKNQATELADAATNKNGAFYDGNGLWNNQLQYEHLLFMGFSDIINLDSDFESYTSEVLRQANYIYNYLQDPNDLNMYFGLIDSSTQSMFSRYSKAYTGGGDSFSGDNNYCPGSSTKIKKSFMDNASIAQILYATLKL